MARFVVPGAPHHITQRGSRRQAVFFSNEDRQWYLQWLSEGCRRFGIQVWAYCLMSNHVHLVAVPSDAYGLGVCLRQVHAKYAWRINRRMKWKGHLWQARFGSSVMDREYTIAAARYVEQNPVRAGLVRRAWHYPWSSARYHVGEVSFDPLLRGDEALRAEIGNWRGFLETPESAERADRLRQDGDSGFPLGSAVFVADLEERYGLRLSRCRQRLSREGARGSQRVRSPSPIVSR